MAKAFDFKDLCNGASVNQLAQLFELDRRTVAERLKEVTPSGRRNQHPVYKVSDVAEYLVAGYMTHDSVTETQKMKRADKEKDYWDAKLKEQKFLENQGDLWRTSHVIEIFADVFKFFRESVVVFVDRLEHESGLPGNVVEKCKSFGDGLLIECREKLLVSDFTEKDEDAEFLREMGLD